MLNAVEIFNSFVCFDEPSSGDNCIFFRAKETNSFSKRNECCATDIRSFFKPNANAKVIKNHATFKILDDDDFCTKNTRIMNYFLFQM